MAGGIWDDKWWEKNRGGLNYTGSPYGNDHGGTSVQFGDDPEGLLARQKQGQSASNGQFLNPDGSYGSVVPNGQVWNPQQGAYAGTGKPVPGAPGTGGVTPAVPGAPGTAQPGVAQIQTTITPRDIYSPQQTQQRVNQATADSLRGGGLNSLLKQGDVAGTSRSGRNTFNALPQIAQANSAAAQAQGAIPLADQAANQQNMLRGQIGQGLEFDQLSRLLLGEQNLNNWVTRQNTSGMGGLLGGLVGMI